MAATGHASCWGRISLHPSALAVETRLWGARHWWARTLPSTLPKQAGCTPAGSEAGRASSAFAQVLMSSVRFATAHNHDLNQSGQIPALPDDERHPGRLWGDHRRTPHRHCPSTHGASCDLKRSNLGRKEPRPVRGRSWGGRRCSEGMWPTGRRPRRWAHSPSPLQGQRVVVRRRRWRGGRSGPHARHRASRGWPRRRRGRWGHQWRRWPRWHPPLAARGCRWRGLLRVAAVPRAPQRQLRTWVMRGRRPWGLRSAPNARLQGGRGDINCLRWLGGAQSRAWEWR